MADPFVAEIRAFPFNFAPKGWAACDGQILPISQNTALFSLLGTYYGGDGKSTFALPNLQGSAAVSVGQGPGLSPYEQGQISGSTTVTLLQSEMPSHPHALKATSNAGELQSPAPDRVMARAAPGKPYGTDPTTNLVPTAPQTLGLAGGNAPHNNMPPYLVIQYCIALQGVFPPRP